MTKIEVRTLADWPKMAWIDQDEEFFFNVRKLHNSGLNPRKQLTFEHVTHEDVFSLFGQKGCRLTSPHLPQADKLGLLNIYWRVFGTEEVTNNEVQGWIVKGYIAEKKKIDINWAKAAAMTATEMARREKRDISFRNPKVEGSTVQPLVHHRLSLLDDSKGSLGFQSEPCFSLSLSGKAGGPNSSVGERGRRESSLPQYHPMFSNTVSAEYLTTPQYLAQVSPLGVCPFPVSTEDIVRVEELIGLNSEFWKTTKSEITALERKKKINQDKLLGLKFSTQDRNAVFAEQAKDLEEKKQELSAQKKSRLSLSIELEILQGKVDAAETADDKAAPLKLLLVMQDELEVLDSDLDTMMRKVDIANSLCDNLRKIAYQGEQVFTNTQLEDHDLEDAILRATMQVSKFNAQHEALSNQAAEMHLGGGMSLWPKPILHPTVPELVLDSSRHVIHLMPCGCCKRWYNCNDVFLTSCKHCYHPACLIEYLKTHTKCLVCNERLHPNWWSSWGIRELDDDLKQLACDLNLEAKRTEQIQAMKNSIKPTSSDLANEFPIETMQLHTELGSTSAFKSIRGRHSLGVADSKDLLSPSSYHGNQKDEFFSHILPTQSRHSALCHSPTTEFTTVERDNCEVDSPYKSAMMHKVLLSKLAESNIHVGNEELGTCNFRQPFNQATKIPCNTTDGFEKVSCENNKSDSLGAEIILEENTKKKTAGGQAVMTDSELQHLGHSDGDKDCQVHSQGKSNPPQNKRSSSAIALKMSVKKMKISIGNGSDDVDEPRKVSALQDLIDVKGKKSNFKWAPTTKKPAKSWGVSAQKHRMIRNLRPRDRKSSE